MRWLQRFFMAVLPRKWADDMRAESQSWQICCATCGKSRSEWDAGGIRWKTVSVGKATIAYCSHCGELRTATIVREPANPIGPAR